MGLLMMGRRQVETNEEEKGKENEEGGEVKN